MRKFVVYEHICTLPDYLDTVSEEMTVLVEENNYSMEKDVEWYVKWLNIFNPTDKFGRKRHFYVYWINCLYLERNEDFDKITFTVKEHKEYKGEKQTEVTRCKVTTKVIK